MLATIYICIYRVAIYNSYTVKYFNSKLRLFLFIELCAIPTNISWMTDCPESSLFFNWSQTISHCSPLWYFITTSNCGNCPATTIHNNISCTDAQINNNACQFTIQSEVRDNVTGHPQQFSLDLQPDCQPESQL